MNKVLESKEELINFVSPRSRKGHSLWQNYLKTHNLKDRNKLVEFYKDFVRSIACKFTLPDTELFDSLMSEGSEQLINCIDNYKPEMEVEFEHFAFINIINKMNRYFRSSRESFTSRSGWELNKTYLEAIELFELIKGFKPDQNQMAEFLEIDLEIIHFIILSLPKQLVDWKTEISINTGLLLEDIIGEEDTSFTKIDEEIDAHLIRDFLIKITQTLSLIRKKAIVNSLSGFEPKEVAQILHVSKTSPRESYARAIKDIRKYLDLNQDIPIHWPTYYDPIAVKKRKEDFYLSSVMDTIKEAIKRRKQENGITYFERQKRPAV